MIAISHPIPNKNILIAKLIAISLYNQRPLTLQKNTLNKFYTLMTGWKCTDRQGVFSLPLKVLTSYAHTVSIPSPATSSGVQFGKGNRQAMTLAPPASSSSSFFSKCGICGDDGHYVREQWVRNDSQMSFCIDFPKIPVQKLLIVKKITSGHKYIIKQSIKIQKPSNSCKNNF